MNPTNGFGTKIPTLIQETSVDHRLGQHKSSGEGSALNLGDREITLESISAEMRNLKEENRRLKEAIIKADGSSSGLEHDNVNSSLLNSSAIASKSTTVDSEKMNARLKAMFKEKIHLFREAVYLLTGYKVIMYCAHYVVILFTIMSPLSFL